MKHQVIVIKYQVIADGSNNVMTNLSLSTLVSKVDFYPNH